MSIYKDPEINAFGYDSEGLDCDSDENTSVAKKTEDISNKTTSYWVKICNGSINSGKLYDPSTNLFEELKRFDSYTGRNRFSYKKVSEECFNHYVSYLTTKKTSFLRNAERGIVS